jgi:hypothetical protein
MVIESQKNKNLNKTIAYYLIKAPNGSFLGKDGKWSQNIFIKFK